MRPVRVDWAMVEDFCVRTGWTLGWTVSVMVGIVGFASGGSPELAAVRALMALIGFVLIGWITGVMVGRMAPLSTPQPQRQPVGTRVDMRVGHDVVWPEPPSVAKTAVGSSNAA